MPDNLLNTVQIFICLILKTTLWGRRSYLFIFRDEKKHTKKQTTPKQAKPKRQFLEWLNNSHCVLWTGTEAVLGSRQTGSRSLALKQCSLCPCWPVQGSRTSQLHRPALLLLLVLWHGDITSPPWASVSTVKVRYWWYLPQSYYKFKMRLCTKQGWYQNISPVSAKNFYQFLK